MTSAVIIAPVTFKEAATQFAISQGWQSEGAVPGTFSVELQTNGVTTHWGCRADVTQGFIDLMAEPPSEALPLLENLIIDLSDTVYGREHFEQVLQANNLSEKVDGLT